MVKNICSKDVSPGSGKHTAYCSFSKITAAVFLVLLLAGLFCGTCAAADALWKGDGTAASPYLISDAADLSLLSEKAQTESFDGVSFKLTADIQYNGIWKSPGPSEDVKFCGTVDGNGHAVYGLLSGENSSDNRGFINYAGEGCCVKNLTLINCEIKAASNSGQQLKASCVGGIIGHVLGHDVSISGCTVKNSTIASDTNNVGGIAGYVSDKNNSSLSIEKCTVEHCDVVSSGTFGADYYGSRIGGIVGCANSDCLIRDCVVKNCKIGTSCGVRAGGLVGCAAAENQTYLNSRASHCLIYAGDDGKTSTLDTVHFGTNVGGLFGGTYQKKGTSLMHGCTAESCIVLSTKGNTGGVIGVSVFEGVDISDCNVVSCIIASGGENVGGVVGYAQEADVSGCTVTASGLSGAGNVGELVGKEGVSNSVRGTASSVRTNDVVLKDASGAVVESLNTALLEKITQGAAGSTVIADLGRYGTADGYGCFKVSSADNTHASSPAPALVVFAGLIAGFALVVSRRK